MNNETYVECLVAHKGSRLMKFLSVLCIVLAVVVFLGGSMIGAGILSMILAIGIAVLAYVAHQRSDVEFEYLYLDREICIDRIYNKTSRKRVATYSTDRMEVFAPITSWHLDDYKNRQVKEIDYSSGEEKQPDPRYVLYYEGGVKLLLEPTPEFVKAVYNVAPRKVFTD